MRKPDHIAQPDWDSVDSPPLTDEQLAQMQPVSTVDPALVRDFQRRRGKQKVPTKQQVTIRLDAEVVAYFRKGGRGWQTRLNETLRQAAGLD